LADAATADSLNKLAFINLILISRLCGPGMLGWDEWDGIEEDILRFNVTARVG